MTESRCGNYGGYSIAMKNVVCGLNCGKACAGYDRKCTSFIHVNPSKKVKVDEG
jgi:hypothetical protein